MIKNYGFKIDEVKDPDAYILGGLTSLPKIVLQNDGQWDKYLPIEENQAPSWETFACTCYGTTSAIEVLLKKIHGQEFNFSERYPYNLVGINPPGADPHKVSEAIRNNGLIAQESLPMTTTLEEFKTPRPMVDKYIEEGNKFGYTIKHEYVFKDSDPHEVKIAKMKECLTYSPLGISVTAWLEKGGVYVDDGQANTHWTVCYGWNDKGWKVFDSYAPYLKIVSFDHHIERSKRYLLEVKTPQLTLMQTLLQKLNDLLNLYKKLLKTMPENTPVPQPVNQKISLSPRESLYIEAKKWLGKDITPQDKIPDEVACAENLCVLIQKLDPDFPIIPNTLDLLKEFKRNTKYKPTLNVEAGNIIINATSTGNNKIRGHTGVILDGGLVASNNSVNGLWSDHWNLVEWNSYYRRFGGMPTHIFEYIG